MGRARMGNGGPVGRGLDVDQVGGGRGNTKCSAYPITMYPSSPESGVIGPSRKGEPKAQSPT